MTIFRPPKNSEMTWRPGRATGAGIPMLMEDTVPMANCWSVSNWAHSSIAASGQLYLCGSLCFWLQSKEPKEERNFTWACWLLHRGVWIHPAGHQSVWGDHASQWQKPLKSQDPKHSKGQSYKTLNIAKVKVTGQSSWPWSCPWSLIFN